MIISADWYYAGTGQGLADHQRRFVRPHRQVLPSDQRPLGLRHLLARAWDGGIVYVLGQINFLTDPSTQPFMTTADLCARFGVGQSTASAKARVISQALETSRLNPEWSLPSLLDQNPLVWMAEVNGFLVDLRDMPREVQQIAFDEGMIPYIPADQEKGPE